MISVTALGFDYPAKPALRDIGFTVAKGAICGLLGPNACGKTTLLKCINGILTPKEGEVRVNGEKTTAMSRQQVARLMAVVPQQMTPVFAFTTLQMVVMGRTASLGRLSLPSRKDGIDAQLALDELGVGGLSNRPFNELSGGERQLVLLARALFQDTPVLLLDEPTSHLDFRNQFMIMDVVSRMTRAKGLATIVSLHDPNLAARYCTHLVVLKEGTLFREGPLERVFDGDTLEQVYGMKVVVERSLDNRSIVLPRPADGGA